MNVFAYVGGLISDLRSACAAGSQESSLDSLKRLLADATPRYAIRPGCEGTQDRMTTVAPALRQASLAHHNYEAWLRMLVPDAEVLTLKAKSERVDATNVLQPEGTEPQSPAEAPKAPAAPAAYSGDGATGRNVFPFTQSLARHKAGSATPGHRKRQRRPVVPRSNAKTAGGH